LLLILLIPIKSYAAIAEEERLNNFLKDTLKINNQDLDYHKNKFLEMDKFKHERAKTYQSSSNNSTRYKRSLIKDISSKYNLNPKNKKDYCDLMERLTFYFSSKIDDLKGSEAKFCSKEGDGCVQVLEYTYPGFDESDVGNEIYVYLISDYAGNPVGIWSLFKANFGITIENKKYFRIHQSPYSDLNSLTNLTEENFLKEKNNISYLKIDGCYIKEIYLKLDNSYIDPSYLQNSKTKNINN